jgi:hypothetical protein
MALLRKNTLLPLFFIVLASGGAFGRDRSHDFSELRGVVDRTQSDLRAASGLEHGDKQRARVQHAQDDLSKLDRKLVRGKFDKDAFQHSLSALKSILDHNTLPVSGRDSLMRDVSELQAAHERR